MVYKSICCDVMFSLKLLCRLTFYMKYHMIGSLISFKHRIKKHFNKEVLSDPTRGKLDNLCCDWTIGMFSLHVEEMLKLFWLDPSK